MFGAPSGGPASAYPPRCRRPDRTLNGLISPSKGDCKIAFPLEYLPIRGGPGARSGANVFSPVHLTSDSWQTQGTQADRGISKSAPSPPSRTTHPNDQRAPHAENDRPPGGGPGRRRRGRHLRGAGGQLGPRPALRPLRLRGLQRPDRDHHQRPDQDLGQLPRPRPGDGLPRRHPGGAARRADHRCRLAALARRAARPAQQPAHLRDLPAGRRSRLPRGHRAGGHRRRRADLLRARLRPLPDRPGDQLRDDRGLRRLPRAGPLQREAEGAAAGPALRVRQRDDGDRGRLHLPRDRDRGDRPLRRRLDHLPVPARRSCCSPSSGPRSWSCAPSSWPASRSGC